MGIDGAHDKSHVSLTEAPIKTGLKAQLVVGFDIDRDSAQSLAAIVPLLNTHPTTVSRPIGAEKLLIELADRIGVLSGSLCGMFAHGVGHLKLLRQTLSHSVYLTDLERNRRIEGLSDPSLVIVMRIDAAMELV